MRPLAALLLPPLLALAALADEPAPPPITTVGGPAGDLLRQWWKEGTAAGNAGDRYDNRDGDHSPLDRTPYPQLGAVTYSAADVKLRRHWAAQHALRPGVVFGNSSTSAPPELGGSNPRHYYVSPAGLRFLHQQYAGNNLYIYPEHRDHDPGHNGRPDGYGDLYPTNTPYLLISQGSSGSDQPFMRALPLVLAAFRPEVKKKLTETGQLMPAVQMLLRRTNKHLKDPAEYLTGKAHPTVFEGAWVDELALVKAAHALELKTLPPVVSLKVVDEDWPTPGVDYFEPRGVTEALADTPAVIARVFRGKDRARRLVVSAADSADPNGAPLTFTWVVLRGDADKITLRPKDKGGAVAEVVVPYPPRRPVAPGAPLESNRVDIGVFAHNGTHYSAPAFVTFFSLDREARTYDEDGRILEIGYGVGEPTFNVSDWPKLLRTLAADDAPADRLKLAPALRKALAPLAAEAGALAAALTAAQAKEKAAAPADRDAARKEVDRARAAVSEFASKRRDALSGSVRDAFDAALGKALRDPDLRKYQLNLGESTPHGETGKRVAAAMKTLARWGLAEDKFWHPFWQTLKERPAVGAFEEAKLDQFHATLLAELTLPGLVQVGYRPNYVDHRLMAAREWRDVYRHDGKGRLLGWTRYAADGTTEYNHDGLLVVEKDGRGRAVKARPVRYTLAGPSRGPNPPPLRVVPEEATVTYEFADDDDLHGRRVEGR